MPVVVAINLGIARHAKHWSNTQLQGIKMQTETGTFVGAVVDGMRSVTFQNHHHQAQWAAVLQARQEWLSLRRYTPSPGEPCQLSE